MAMIYYWFRWHRRIFVLPFFAFLLSLFINLSFIPLSFIPLSILAVGLTDITPNVHGLMVGITPYAKAATGGENKPHNNDEPTNNTETDVINFQDKNFRWQHGFSMWGKVKYPKGFDHFPNVNPNAPIHGRLVLGAQGGFDSFNSFLIQGIAPSSISIIYESLMTPSPDEADAVYGLIADGVFISPDKKTVAFHINPKAYFHDGAPITAADVVWTFETLMRSNNPTFRSILRDLTSVKAIGRNIVVFTTNNPSNRNLPQVLAGTPILPKHFWEDSNHPRDFNKPSLEVPLGSAAYRVKEFYPSKFIIYERVDNYWGKNLNVSKGKFNYKTIKFQFYRDDTIQMEAFKTGQIDVRFENIARQWANSYDFSAVKNGDVIKNDFRQKRIAPAQVIQFNLRRPLFGGPEGRVLRQALQYLWNFEWINRNLMYNAYVRTQSLFDNSVLQAQGPPSPAELRLLLPFKDKLPADVFGQPYQAPVDSGNNILTAVNLLKANGWYYNNNHQLISPRGQKIEFTLMISSPVFISILQPFVQNVKRIGGKVVLRVMDPAVYERTMMNFDYDATVVVYASSLSPGVEQRLYWGSESANQRGSNNISGVQSPTIDSLLEKLIKADNYNDLTTIARALDRVVMWNYYFIPMHHSNVDRIAWWNKFSCPNYLADSGPDIFYCWIDKKKESALKKEGYKQ